MKALIAIRQVVVCREAENTFRIIDTEKTNTPSEAFELKVGETLTVKVPLLLDVLGVSDES